MKKNPVGTLIVLVAAVISFLGLVLPFYSVDFLGQFSELSDFSFHTRLTTQSSKSTVLSVHLLRRD